MLDQPEVPKKYSKEWTKALNVIAEAYDRFRPAYPASLVDDVVFLSGIQKDGKVLEIGCGAGQATVMFASRGYSLVALEPGATLAEFARLRCAGMPNLRVEVSALEDWQSGTNRFDLIFAAQSFHFLDSVERFRRAANLLQPDGALAVFWNYRLPGETMAHRVLPEAYRRHAPTLIPDQLSLDTPFEDEIDKSGLFGSVFMRKYLWTQFYATTDYIGLLQSHASHQLLPEAARKALLDEIAAGLDSSGGGIAIDYVTRLYVARVR